ncbi:hypothetical protein [Mucisphaera sp.]|uniref:hypothetical protein n=1 Tax=Mucisphaera sp. TaxID=2913024 RepID=UPI003D12B778
MVAGSKWIGSGLLLVSVLLCGCHPHRQYNTEPEQYLQVLSVPGQAGVSFDLGIVEFDDHGQFWDESQLDAVLGRIAERNAESERGILVLPFVHGWKNNADPSKASGDLVDFKQTLGEIAVDLQAGGEATPEAVIGVYLGWRGDTSMVPLQKQATFWGRRFAAERIASLNMRETLFRLMRATNKDPRSKVYVVGHSMGGLIVGQTLSQALTTLLMASGEEGLRVPANFTVLMNPALDALKSWQVIDYLKRANVRLELRRPDGSVELAPGPIIASITSEADRATGIAYPFGRSFSTVFTEFRNDHEEGEPSQRHLSLHAEGHVDYLVSHRAYVENGEVVLERVEGAYNDTPFWVIRVTKDICADHNDTRNPMLGRLIEQVSGLNSLYESDVSTWLVADYDLISGR